MIVGEAGRERGPAGQAFVGIDDQLMDMFLGHRHEPRARPLHHKHFSSGAAGNRRPPSPSEPSASPSRRHIELARDRDRGAGRRHGGEGVLNTTRHHRLRGKWTSLTLDDGMAEVRAPRPSTRPTCCAPPANARLGRPAVARQAAEGAGGEGEEMTPHSSKSPSVSLRTIHLILRSRAKRASKG